MPVEIERRFLVRDDSWKLLCTLEPKTIVQGYVAKGENFVVRIRIAGNLSRLTLKSKKNGMVAHEYEYDIPHEDAEEIMKTIPSDQRIEKKRYNVSHAGSLWEVDEFFGENMGLCIAEIELQHEHEPIALPDWTGEEITDDVRYSNFCLSQYPYSKWTTGIAGV